MKRKEEFLPDGIRRLAIASDIISTWRAATTVIPAQFALGTAQHEASFTVNEKDTEPSGYISMGIFQLGQEEIDHVKVPGADVYTLAGSVALYVPLALERLHKLLVISFLDATCPPADIWFYLAMAHNMGLGAALKSIKEHGLNAAAWTARNPQLAQAAVYFNDCITGGKHWTPELNA